MKYNDLYENEEILKALRGEVPFSSLNQTTPTDQVEIEPITSQQNQDQNIQNLPFNRNETYPSIQNNITPEVKQIEPQAKLPKPEQSSFLERLMGTGVQPQQELSYEDEVKRAQNEGLFQSGISDMSQGLANLGGAIAREKPSQELIKSLQVDQDRPLRNIQELQKARDIDKQRQYTKQFTDPNSDISRYYKDYIKQSSPQLGQFKDFDKLSAKQLQDLGLKIQKESEMSEYQRGMLDIYRQRIEQGGEREVRLGETQKWKEKEKDELSDKQTGEIESLDQGIGKLDELEELKPAFDTGPIAGRVASLRKSLGNDNAKISAFKARVGRLMANYMKSISGAAISEQEASRLMSNLPTENTSDGAFLEILKDLRSELQKEKGRKIEAFKKQGKNVSNFADEDAKTQTQQVQKESDQDKKAKEWLKANPDHPKAETVRQKLQSKGLL